MTDSLNKINLNKSKKKSLMNDSTNVDELMNDLNMEEFKNILDQVVDHSLPENKKSLLVQKLNQEQLKKDIFSETNSKILNLDKSLKQTKLNNKFNKKTNKNNDFINCEDNYFQSNNSPLQNLQNLCGSKVTNLDKSLKQNKLNNKLNKKISKNNDLITCEDNYFQSNDSPLQKLQSLCDSFNLNSKNDISKLNSNFVSQKKEINNTSLKTSDKSINQNSFDSSLKNYEQNSKENNCCDTSDCDMCKHKKKLLYNVLNDEKFEMQDFRKKAQIIEFSPKLENVDLNEEKKNCQENLSESYKKDVEDKLRVLYDFINSKDELKNVKLPEKLSEVLEKNKSFVDVYYTDKYQKNKAEKQTINAISSSTSDGNFSSMNSFNENEIKLANHQMSSNQQRKGTTQSIIQTDGKLENNYSKKRKKVEKAKFTEEIEGYVGYKEIDFLTNYITGNNNLDNMHEININKEINKKKKEKKDLTNFNSKKKNNKEINNVPVSGNLNDQNRLESSINSNDKNNNSNLTADNNIIPNNSAKTSKGLVKNNPKNNLQKNLYQNNEKVCEEFKNDFNKNQDISQNLIKNKKNFDKKNLINKNLVVQVKKQLTCSTENKTSTEKIDNEYLITENKKYHSTLNSEFKIETTQNSIGIVSEEAFDINQMYIVSDSEVPDQEGDFKIVKYKQLRRKKHKKLSNNQETLKLSFNDFNNQNNNKKANNGQNLIDKELNISQNATTARGYESELDYCADEFRKRQEYKSHRKVFNSISDKNKSSSSNSDSDVSSTQVDTYKKKQLDTSKNNSTLTNVTYSKISYAAIAKMNYSCNNSNKPNLRKTSVPTTNSTIKDESKTNVASFKTPIVSNQLSSEANKNLKKNRNGVNNLSETTKMPKNNNHSTVKKTETKTFEISNNNYNLKNENKKKIELIKSSDFSKKPKQIIKLNKSDKFLEQKTELTPKKFNSHDLKEDKLNSAATSNDSSRTISLDLNEIPSVISSKSGSSFSSGIPPVIMLDNKNDSTDSQFTFGFFDGKTQPTSYEFEETNKQFESINVNSVNFISNGKDQIVEKEKDKISNNFNVCKGTYILESELNSSKNTICDNITKKVQSKFSNEEQCNLVKKFPNEITSINLTKFKEKIPSPINLQPQIKTKQTQKKNEPNKYLNIGYLQVVNYIHRAWEEAYSNSKSCYFKSDLLKNGPVSKANNFIYTLNSCN